jgi:MFS family permease
MKLPTIPMSKMRWVVVFVATFVLAVNAGGRFLIGVVFDQIRDTFTVTHGTIGLVVTMNVLVVGITQPVVGWLVDKFPTRYVTGGGILLVGLGLILTGSSDSLFMLFFGYGFVVALGLAAVSPVAVTPVVSGWFQKRRATALSIVNSGGAIGQLAIVPALTITVGMIGWRDSYIFLGLGLALIGGPLFFLLLREREEAIDGSGDAGFGCSVRQALTSAPFWQLGWGFFVCGFTMAWVMTFYVDYALTTGLTREQAAIGLSVMGGMSIAGVLFMGWWADRVARMIPLSLTYLMRGSGFALLFLAGTNLPLVLVAMAIIGISWTATISVTSAMSADIFGRIKLGTIFGLMFAIMPLGSALGSALAGFLHDVTGSYAITIWVNFAVGISAGLVVLLIRSAPMFEGPSPQPSRPITIPAD